MDATSSPRDGRRRMTAPEVLTPGAITPGVITQGVMTLAMLLAATVMPARAGSGDAAAALPMPALVSHDGRRALLVDGAPFLMLGAQVNNSSNWPAMLPKVWPAIAALHANTVEVPISWEQIEPAEGRFDFSFLDVLLAQARDHGVHLVLLWFGTWKNNGPNYAPAWVKLDNKRFPRVIDSHGQVKNSLSPLAASTLDADRRAFTALMRRLRETDAPRTVIMVQVENETGTYGSVRDYSPMAERAFDSPVPPELLAALKRGSRGSNWRTAFGQDADEFFHAWSIARYVDAVAAAGKAEYPLPMYVNAALRDPFKYQDPVTYSSGGPTHNVLDVWKAAAKAIDVIGPDIYSPSYEFCTAILQLYDRPDNVLFVPEMGNQPVYARYLYAVLGRHAIGYSPFGMDFTGYANYPLGAKSIDEATIEAFAVNYRVLAPMARVWAKLAFEGETWGVSEQDERARQELDLGRWHAVVEYDRYQFGGDWAKAIRPVGPAGPDGGVLVARLGADEFLVIGRNARISFSAAKPSPGHGMIFDRVEEGHYDQQGRWTFERIWNGDQTDYGLNFTTLPQVLHVRLAIY
jgi:beta-galactosidase GanA